MVLENMEYYAEYYIRMKDSIIFCMNRAELIFAGWKRARWQNPQEQKEGKTLTSGYFQYFIS